MLGSANDLHITQELWISCIGCNRTIVANFEPSFIPRNENKEVEDSDEEEVNSIKWPWYDSTGVRLDYAITYTTCRACRLDIYDHERGLEGTETLMEPSNRDIARMRRLSEELNDALRETSHHSKYKYIPGTARRHNLQVSVRRVLNDLIGISKQGSITFRYLLLDVFRENRLRDDYDIRREILTYKMPGDFI